jgi:NADH dehydrogenase
VFQPMLPEVVGGSVSPRHVVNPLRLLCRGVEVFRGTVEEIQWKERRLTLNAGDFARRVDIHFSRLVLALGAVVDLSRIPGMPEHAYLMRNVGDAMRLRSTIISRIEEASLVSDPEARQRLLTFVVVGGGFSGVETAGQILDLLGAIHGYYSHVSREELRVYLVHSQDHLLPMFSERLGEYTARKLEQRGLRLVLQERVESVTAHRVLLRSGRAIETNTVVCTVGNAPHPLVTELCRRESLPSLRGRVETEPTCQVKGAAGLWAAGDCAAIPCAEGGYCPETAQFAMRQGVLVGRNIARAERGEPLKPFEFRSLGQMAAIGHRSAVASIRNFSFSGFFAWWLWRTVYLAKLPGIDRKIRVMIDWTLDLFFPRDINLLTPRYSNVLKEVYLTEGAILFSRGEPAFSLYIVKSGQLEIRDDVGVVQVIGPGEYVGERALLNDRIWHFDGRASEPTVVVSVPGSAFQHIARGAGSLGRMFQKSAARYQSREILRSMTERLPARLAGARAGDIMRKPIIFLRPEMSAAEALEVTRAHPHSAYPVLDPEGRLKGVLQREDFYEFLKDPDTRAATPVGKAPLTALPTVAPDASLGLVLEAIVRSGASKALVTNGDGRVNGIVTLVDLLVEENKAGGGAFPENGAEGVKERAAEG